MLLRRTFVTLSLVVGLAATPTVVQVSRYEDLASLPFKNGYPSKEGITALKDELIFQRAVQSYLWALPVLNMYGMKEGSEKVFGKGYNILPIWKQRLNAKTLITTPNSDVIYALGYLDLKEDGPIVIEVPPGLQGILDDFFQRPICSEGQIGGRVWCGDVGLPGPDKGKGGKYLLLPPDFKGKAPEGYLTFRSRTYGVFVFWRGFFKDPKQLNEPVKVMEQTRIYPLGKKAAAKPMQFPDASAVPANMLYPSDGSAFDMLNRFIQHEYADPADMEMRGMLAALGIEKGKPFNPIRARATFSTRRQRPPIASVMRSPMSRRRLCPTASGTRIGAGLTSFRAIRRLPRTRSITSIRGRASSPLPIPRARGWRSTWRTLARSTR